MTKLLQIQIGDKQNDSMHVICLVEQHNYSQNYLMGIEMRTLLERGVCIRHKDQYSFRATGFILHQNRLLAIFPKGYIFPSKNEVIDHVRILAGVLLRYRNEQELTSEENEWLFGNDSGIRYGIGAALWLMNDFFEFGLISRRVKETKLGHGSIVDWARTVKTTDAFVSNKKPVYLNYVIRKSNEDLQNKIILLHRFAVQESLRLFGWIWGVSLGDFNFPVIDSPFDDGEIDRILKHEYISTNVDREIQLLNMIRHFLLGSSTNIRSDQVDMLATPYFHTVWEKICGYLFDNQYDKLKKLIPKPVLYWNTPIRKKKLSQIPDILYTHSGDLYILDAKYYNTEVGNLPGWPDLVKQFFYAYSMQKENQVTINVMVFPSSDREQLVYKGYAIIKEKSELGRVEAVGLNTYIAMNKYVSYDQIDLREQLRIVLSSDQNNANGHSFSVEL